MSDGELLGRAVLELTTDDRPLIAGLANAKRRGEVYTKDMQAMVSSSAGKMGVAMAAAGTQVDRHLIPPLQRAEKASKSTGQALATSMKAGAGATGEAALKLRSYELAVQAAQAHVEKLNRAVVAGKGDQVALNDALNVAQGRLGLAQGRLDAYEGKLRKTHAETRSLAATTGISSRALSDLSSHMGPVGRGLDDLTARSRLYRTHGIDYLAAGVIGLEAAFVGLSVRAAIRFEDLGRTVARQTGLTGDSLDHLMGTIRNVARDSPYQMTQVSDAAVILRQEFHLTDAQIGQTANDMVAFANATGSEVRPQMQQLSRIMTEYRQPLGNVVGLTDKLVSVSQATQQPIGSMVGALDRFGPKLQALGFNLDDSLRLLGVFTASGIKADQMGRGLAAALTSATKAQSTQAKLLTDGPAKLQAYRLAVEAAQLRVDKLSRAHITGSSTQADLNMQMTIAEGRLATAKGKYDTLTQALAAAKKGHTDVATSIRDEIAQITNAKSPQAAMSLAVADFGKNLGPSMARAYYNNAAALAKVDGALRKTGSTQRLFGVDQKSIAGETRAAKNNFQDLEITIGTKVVPALSHLLGHVRSGVHDIDTFVKHNQTLVEVLGGVGLGLAGITLASRHISPLGNLLGGIASRSGHRNIANILTGGGSGSGIFGFRGPAAPGSPTNPIVVTMEGGGGPAGLPGAPGAAKEAESGATKLEKFLASHPYVAAAARFTPPVMVAATAAAAGYGLYKEGQGVAKNITTPWDAYHKATLTPTTQQYLDALFGKPYPFTAGRAPVPGMQGASARGQSLAQQAQETTQLTRAQRDLTASSAALQHAQQAVNLARQTGTTHSAAYRQALLTLRSAESQHRQALAEVAAAERTSGSASLQLRDNYARLQHDGGQSFARIQQDATTAMTAVKTHLGTDSAQGGQALAQNFQAAASAVLASMRANVIHTDEGIKDINKLMSQALKALGVDSKVLNTTQQASLLAGLSSGAILPQSVQGGGAINTPGRFYSGGKVDRPGYFAGEEAPQHPEYILATNPAYRKRNLGLWAAAGGALGIPGFAQGGLTVRGPASTFGPPGEPAGGTAYGHSSSEAGIAVNPHGGSHWDDALARSLAGKVAVVRLAGHSANLPVIDKGPSAIGAHGPRLIDVTGAGAARMGLSAANFPTDATAEAIFGTGATLIGGAAGRAAAAIPRVIAKGVSGLIGHVTQGVIDRVRDAANAKIAAASAAGGARGGAPSSGAPVGPAQGPVGTTVFEGIRMATWIANELRWATQHGWHGQPTSGYRPGVDPHTASGTSEHQGTQYPHGAVDFGGFTDPSAYATKSALVALAARLHYPGPRLQMPIGFHDDGHLSGTGHYRGGIYPGYATGARHPAAGHIIRPPKGNKPKLIKAPKARTPPRAPKLRALSGFDNALIDQIDQLDQVTIPELGSWQGYLTSLHGQTPVSPTVTLPDGSTPVNWGSDHASLGELTGMVDPATRQKTKGIWDRIREIGDITHSPDPNAPDRNTELGVDEALLDYMLREQGLAGVASREFGPWLWNTTKQVAAETAQVAWLNQALDEGKSLAPEGALFAGFGPKPVGREVHGGGRPVVSPTVAQQLLTYGRDLKNSFAAIARWRRIKQELPLVKARRDAQISRRFAAARHRLANQSITGAFSASALHSEQLAGLANEEKDALKGVPSYAPKDWVGDGNAWVKQRAGEHGQISTEFTARRKALDDGFKQKSLQGRLSKSNALFALSSNEATEKLALAQRYGYESIDLANSITSRTGDQKTDKAYLQSILSAITQQQSTDQASLDAATTQGGGFATKLAAYLDPYGPLSLGIQTKQTIDIPGLQRERAGLLGTTAPPAGPSSADTQMADLLKQQLLQSQQALAVSQAQYKVLAALPPYGGSFATGGIVPGPQGMPRTIIAHGGEAITPVGGDDARTHVHLSVANGMEWLRDFIRVEVTHGTRGMAVNAGRALPGAGGGLSRL